MNIKSLRQKRGLSYRKLSELSGVPKRTIEAAERRDNCLVSTALRLATALNVTMDELCLSFVENNLCE